MNPRAVLAAGVLGAFGVAMTMPAFAETDYVANYGIKEDIPGVCSYASIDAKDYTGHEITILTHAVPVMGEPVALHSKQFEELTGGTVNVVHAPFGELYHKVMIPFQTGQHIYDIVYGGSYWIGDWAPHLAPVPQKYLDTDEMKDITPSYQGRRQLERSTPAIHLRRRPELLQIHPAALRGRGESGQVQGRVRPRSRSADDLGGVCRGRHLLQRLGLGRRRRAGIRLDRDRQARRRGVRQLHHPLASYAKNPNVTGGFWFDLDTMTPQVNNPGFVKGLEMWMDALRLHAAGRYQLWHRRRDLLLGRRPIADERDLGRRLHPGDAAGFADPATRSASVPSTAPPWARTRCGTA